MRVAARRLHVHLRLSLSVLEFYIPHFKNRHIKRAAAEIVDNDFFFLLLIEMIRERRGRRLIDNAAHLEPRDFSGIFGCLSLRVIKVSRNGNDGFFYFFAELGFRVGFEFRENEG